jgi:hypothetical protein
MTVDTPYNTQTLRYSNSTNQPVAPKPPTTAVGQREILFYAS